MSVTAHTIRGEATRLRGTSFHRGRMHAALVSVGRALADADDTFVAEVGLASGLSTAMVRFALETSGAIVTHDALARLEVSTVGMTPVGLAGIVLAGNVTSAAIRAIAVPLALGLPVLVKASSRDAVVALAFASRLRAIDAISGERLTVLVYEGGDVECDAALADVCDVLHVYGADDTIAAFEALASSTKTRTVAHGHGFGVAIVAKDAVLEEAARAIACDVVAYDQRGCLSPHAAFVVGDVARRDAFAKALFVAMEQSALAPGTRDLMATTERNTARVLAVMEGDVLEGETSIVACAPVLRASPLHRFVRVIAVGDAPALARILVAASRDLTCIGVAGTLDDTLTQTRWPRARVVRAGTMQMPELDADVDGLPCFEGFVEVRNERI